MKILQINSVFRFGSTGRLVEELSIFFQGQRFESYIAYGRGNDYSKCIKNHLFIGDKKEQAFHLIKTRILDRHGFGSKNSTMRLIKEIDAIKPDIILLHNLHGYYLNIEMLFNYLKNKNINVVWLLHDAWAMSGHSAHFKLTVNQRIPRKNISFKQRFEYPTSWLVDNSKRNYMKKKELFNSINNLTIVTPSDWLNEIVKKSFLKKNDVITINNGIDTELFNINKDIKRPNKFKNKKIILGVASKWTEKKGLKIFNELAEKLDSEAYIIILIGVTKKDLRIVNKKILAISRTENIEELVNYYNLAHVFINPTYEDNFPTTNIEALACGTPVITFKTGGSPEAIDSKTGIVTPKKTSDSIIMAMQKLETMQIKSADCRRRGNLFSKEIMFSKYMELIQTISKGEKIEEND